MRKDTKSTMDLHEIIIKAWDDEAFKQELLRNPKAAIEKELGVSIPEGIDIQIHEQTDTTIHLVLPPKPEKVQAAEGS